MSASGGARRVLEAWRLGVVKYGEALQLQERLVADRKAGRVGDLVLSLQHPPTYTLGKQREKAERNLLAPEAELRALGAELHRTERGGDVTFHGPWQAVLYPVLSLRGLGLGARKYVEGLESAMIQVAALHGVAAALCRLPPLPSPEEEVVVDIQVVVVVAGADEEGGQDALPRRQREATVAPAAEVQGEGIGEKTKSTGNVLPPRTTTSFSMDGDAVAAGGEVHLQIQSILQRDSHSRRDDHCGGGGGRVSVV